MKRLFIFALMTMAASSSFAMSDILNCINGRVNVTTARYLNDEKNLRLSANFMVDDLGTFQSIVETEQSFTLSQKTFTGVTAEGRQMKLVVKGYNHLKGTLTIEGLPAEKGFICKEQILFPL